MADWKHLLLEHADKIPFFLATRAGDGPAMNRLNTTRIMESLIIAGITGGIVMYGAQMKLDAQMAEQRAFNAEIRMMFADMKRDMKDDRQDSVERDRRVEDRINALHSPGRSR